MGDRCRVHGVVKTEDWPDFQTITNVSLHTEQDFLPELTEFEDDQANYGLYDECRRAADSKLTFVLYNSAGDAYGKGMYVSLGDGVLHSAECGEEGWPMVPLQADHTVCPESLATAVAASKAEAAVRALHKEPEKAQED